MRLGIYPRYFGSVVGKIESCWKGKRKSWNWRAKSEVLIVLGMALGLGQKSSGQVRV